MAQMQSLVDQLENGTLSFDTLTKNQIDTLIKNGYIQVYEDNKTNDVRIEDIPVSDDVKEILGSNYKQYLKADGTLDE